VPVECYHVHARQQLIYTRHEPYQWNEVDSWLSHTVQKSYRIRIATHWIRHLRNPLY